MAERSSTGSEKKCGLREEYIGNGEFIQNCGCEGGSVQEETKENKNGILRGRKS